MPATKAFVKSLLVVFAFALTVSVSNAQQDPNFAIGLTPYGSYQSGDIDYVSMSNGSLGVDIPLISYPQRGGKLELDFAVNYLNSSGYEAEWCDDDGCYDYWVITVGVLQPIEKAAAALSNMGPTASPLQVVLADGTSHLLGELSGTDLLETVDSSGYRVHSGSSSSTSLTGRDGTVYGLPGYYGTYSGTFGAGSFSGWDNPSRTDSNGNKITYSTSSGWTDTLGRSIPEPTTTTDYSKCTGSETTTSAVLWDPPGYDGGDYDMEFCYFTDSTTGYTELQSIVLLNNDTAWTFQWEPYLLEDPEDELSAYVENLTQITFPTGGTLSYTWGTTAICGSSPILNANLAVATRTLDPNSSDPSQAQTYSYSDTGYGYGTETTTVTDSEGNDTVHTFSGVGGYSMCKAPYETEKQVYQGSQSGGNVLETVNTTYSYTHTSGTIAYDQLLDVVPSEVKTTDNTGLPYSDVKYTYDGGFTFKAFGLNPLTGDTGGTGSSYTGTWGDVLTKKEYNYSGSSLLRTTTNTYLPISSSTYATDNLLDLISSVKITDSGGTQQAYTTYCYDGSYGSCSGSESLVTTSGLPGRTTSPDGNYRGNLSTTSRWLNKSTTSTSNCSISVSNSNVVSFNVYNDTGTVNYSVDSCGTSVSDSNHKTIYTYDSTAGAYVTEIQYPPTGSSVSHNEYFTNDFNTGLLTSHQGQNGSSQTTDYSYDNMMRVATVTNPDGGGQSYCYMDTSSSSCSTAVPSFVLTKKINGSENFVEVGVVDGVGRIIQTQTTASSGVAYVDTHYDDMGNQSAVSNPDSTSTTSDDKLTTTLYNAMKQPCLVIPPDGTSESSCPTSAPANDIFTSYSGETTTVTDEAGKTRESQVNELGHMITVTEDPSGLDYVTTYGYDVLDDLTSVSENSSRSRTFSYDSLSHLTSAANPESGTTCYGTVSGSCQNNGYDADGNLIKKTDARGIVTTASYDNLNRLTEKAYTGGTPSTPTAYYDYDGQSQTGCSVSYSYGSYPKPQRTAMCDATGNEAWSYDIMSRIATDQRTTNSVSMTTTYATSLNPYNYDSSVAQMQYPSGDTFTNTWDQAEHLTSTQDTTNSINYGNSAVYAPSGLLQSLTNGSNLVSTQYYDPNRLQPCRLAVNIGSSTPPAACGDSTNYGYPLDLGYSFDLSTMNTVCSTSFGSATNNGSIASITNNITGGKTQNLCYDSLNRISQAETTATYSTGPSYCWGESYTIDPWGNLTAITPMAGSYSGCTQENLGVSATSANQLSTGATPNYTYDADGNMTNDTVHSYTYDAENRLVQVDGTPGTCSTATECYVYDGDGKRVEKATSSVSKIYWYDISGSVLDETDGSGSTSNSSFYEYIFFDGRRIARRDSSSNVEYYFADHLASTRVVTDPSGTVKEDCDYYPYGGSACAPSSINNYLFTGKERDSESNLDNFGARYYSSQRGRFMSPDPYNAGADLTNPQSWNMYSYVLNNPLIFVDPTGRSMQCTTTTTTTTEVVVDDDGNVDEVPVTSTTMSCTYFPDKQSDFEYDYDTGHLQWLAFARAFTSGGLGQMQASKEVNQCAAANAKSAKKSLFHSSSNNIFVNSLFGNDLSSLSNLAFGPSRGSAAGSLVTSNPTPANLSAFAARTIANRVAVTTTTTASVSVSTPAFDIAASASESTTSSLGATAFGQLLGKAATAWNAGKVAFDVASYLSAEIACAVR